MSICCICVYDYVKHSYKEEYITDKGVNYNLWICMNAKIYKDILSAQFNYTKLRSKTVLRHKQITTSRGCSAVVQ